MSLSRQQFSFTQREIRSAPLFFFFDINKKVVVWRQQGSNKQFYKLERFFHLIWHFGQLPNAFIIAAAYAQCCILRKK